MSITRRFLKGIQVTDEQMEAIIEEHTAVTGRMQAEIDDLKKYKEDAEKLPGLQKELEDAKKQIADMDELKKQLADEKKAFADFKTETENKATVAKVKDAYKALLKAQNVDDKRFDAILKVTDFGNMKLDEKGKFENEKELADAIKNEWKEFIVTTEERGTDNVQNPPAKSGASAMTKEQILTMKDATARQKAIADNPGLFGYK